MPYRLSDGSLANFKPYYAASCGIVDCEGHVAPIRLLALTTKCDVFKETTIEMEGTLIGDRNDYHHLCETIAEKFKDHDLKYKKVVFNPPATIVLWENGSKTVVKCDDKDTFDKEKGLALCFMKKALGNTSRALNDILHNEIPEETDKKTAP